MTPQPKRPAFGTLLASHMAVAALSRRQVEPERDQTGRLARNQSRGARAALCKHLLRRIQGIPPCRRLRARVPHGSAYAAPAAEHPLAGAAAAGFGAGRRHGPRGDQSLPRCRAGSAGRAVPASHHFWHDGEHRRGHDSDHRGDAVGARQSGMGLLCGRREAAAHSGRRSEHAFRAAHGHGENRRQLRRGTGAHHERTGAISGRSGAVLPRWPGSGDRRRQFHA